METLEDLAYQQLPLALIGQAERAADEDALTEVDPPPSGTRADDDPAPRQVQGSGVSFLDLTLWFG